jgi:hypothetical protein
MGMEASGHALVRTFADRPAVWVVDLGRRGRPHETGAEAETDCQDAQLLLQFMMENRFPS